MPPKARPGIASSALAAALFAVLLLMGAAAHAAPLDARERDARADFAAGRYQKAVEAFAVLFAETGDPIFLRNIGRCYQKMQRPQEAIDGFQEYLLKAKALSRSERKEIEGYIKEMEALKAAGPATRPAAPPTPPAAPPPPAATATSATPPPPNGAAAAATGESSSPPAAISTTTPPGRATDASGILATAPTVGRAGDDGRSWRIAGIATGAAGVALIAAGLAYGAAAQSAADAVSQQYNAATASDGKRDATLQWVGYGAGAAALATGVILYFHGMPSRRAPDRTARLRLHGGAAFDQTGGAFLVQGTF